jgi:DNA-binding CsgD family transcriptional regulator
MGHSPDVLTDREREVVRLLADGLTAKETGRKLGISGGVVGNHRQNIYRKLGLNRAAALARWAQDHGIVNGARKKKGRAA